MGDGSRLCAREIREQEAARRKKEEELAQGSVQSRSGKPLVSNDKKVEEDSEDEKAEKLIEQ